MFNQPFYHSLIRKYVTLFGTLFSSISVNYKDETGVYKTKQVPLMYGPRDRMMERVQSDPDLDKPSSMQYPRMAFEIVGYQYDPGRKLKTIGYSIRRDPSNPDQKYQIYNPVPYNIAFNLYIGIKSEQDGHQIVEQILPYFTPDWTSTIMPIEGSDVQYDIPLLISGIYPRDNYDAPVIADRREQVWTISFEMKALFFGPEKTGKIIKFVDVGLHQVTTERVEDSVGHDPRVETYQVYPGLTANGTPTSLASEAIDYHLVNESDDYGYVETVIP